VGVLKEPALFGNEFKRIASEKFGAALAPEDFANRATEKNGGGKGMDSIQKKRFFRLNEVAAILDLSRRSIYRMIHDGRLTAVRWGTGPWRIPRESLAELFPEGTFPNGG
jgi:excisionase family DNA binding protein